MDEGNKTLAKYRDYGITLASDAAWLQLASKVPGVFGKVLTGGLAVYEAYDFVKQVLGDHKAPSAETVSQALNKAGVDAKQRLSTVDARQKSTVVSVVSEALPSIPRDELEAMISVLQNGVVGAEQTSILKYENARHAAQKAINNLSSALGVSPNSAARVFNALADLAMCDQMALSAVLAELRRP